MSTRKDEINRLKRVVDTRFSELITETELLNIVQMLKTMKQELLKTIRAFQEIEPQ